MQIKQHAIRTRVVQAVQQSMVESLPNACSLPIAEPAPAGHSTSVAQLLREHPPRDARAQDEENAGKRRASGDARSAPLQLRRFRRKERLDHTPTADREQAVHP